MTVPRVERVRFGDINFTSDTLELISKHNNPNTEGISWILKCKKTNERILVSVMYDSDKKYDVLISDEYNDITAYLLDNDIFDYFEDARIKIIEAVNTINCPITIHKPLNGMEAMLNMHRMKGIINFLSNTPNLLL